MKVLKFICLTITSTFLLLGCATKPVIDTKGVDMEAYQQDLSECQDIVEQLDSNASIAKTAGFGALVIGGLSAVVGGDTAQGASVGAIQGGAVGAIKSDDEEFRVLKNCLTNRGYTVLN